MALDDVHTIYRLNQNVPSVRGDRIAGVGQRLYTAPLPNGNVFTERTGFKFSGDPLSIVAFRFNLDQASWAIIADSEGMRKYRGSTGATGTAGYYQKLGITPPKNAAIASDGGVGVLDSTGGTNYDWRYTWFNIVTGSESNPAPETQTAPSTEVRRPAAFTNPDVNFSGAAWTSPGNAFDGNDATFASGVGASATETRQSCLWRAWAASGGVPTTVALVVDAEFILTGTTGVALGTIYYTLDGGTTWKTMVASGNTRERFVYTADIPAGTPYASLQVRAIVFGSGVTNLTPIVIRRRGFETVGGEFNTAELTSEGVLVGGGGDTTLTIRIYDIRTDASLVGAATSGLALVNRSANVCVDRPTDTQVTHIRLYRRGGSLPDNWLRQGTHAIASLLSGACGASKFVINDNTADSGLGDPLELDNDVPVSSVEALERPLQFIWGPFDERVLGCGDPDRPESVYFSKRGNADQWTPDGHIEVSDPGRPMMNGVVYNTRCFAFSTERLYELLPNLIQGVTFVAFPTPCARGLISNWGVAVAEAIYFVSKDGVYRSTGGPEESITNDSIQPLFPTGDSPGRDVHGYEAVDMNRPDAIKLAYHNDEIWFTYLGATSGSRQQLIYDRRRGRWRAADYDPEVVTFFSEESTISSLLLGGTNGKLYTAGGSTDDGVNIPVSFRTGARDQGQPLNLKEYAGVIFDIDPGGATAGLPVTITPLRNGEVLTDAALTITGTGRQQVPLDLSDVFGFNLEFQITWTRTASINPVIYQYDILWRPEPASVRVWYSRETSFGAPGYVHARDAYIEIRSSADVTLTMTFDGTAQTYTLASTAGARRKVRVPFASNKGKVYAFKLSSASEFRIYSEGVECRIKPFLTNLGYAMIPAVGVEEGVGAN